MIEWIQANWPTIAAALAALWAVVLPAIAALTPTEADNKAIAWVNSMARRFGLDLTDLGRKKEKKD